METLIGALIMCWLAEFLHDSTSFIQSFDFLLVSGEVCSDPYLAFFIPSYLSSRPNERSWIENKPFRNYFPAIDVGPKRYWKRYSRRGKSHFIEKADIVAIGENLFDIWFRQVQAFIILEVWFNSIK